MNEFFSLGKKAVGTLAFLAFAAIAQAAMADTTGTLLPMSDGTFVQWATSSGTSHYTLVDEAACNGTTDYTYANTVGKRDSYHVSLASIPDGATLTSISISPCASKHTKKGGGSSTLNLFYVYNGIKSTDAGNYSLSGTTPSNLPSTAFAGLSLIKSATTNLEIGAVFSAGNRGARLSRVAATITYTPLLAPTNLTASSTASSTVMLGWQDNATTEGGYVVERSTDNITFSQIVLLGANTVHYQDVSPPFGILYYRVYTFNGGGNSGYSNTAQIVSPMLPGAPSIPGNPPPLAGASGMLQSIASSIAAVQNGMFGTQSKDYTSIASTLELLSGMLRKIAELALR